ncbi:MAG: phage portal protein, partial [Flavihumibacter sp.]|nr:phage portal protein [Flavihumibacter sp.]
FLHLMNIFKKTLVAIGQTAFKSAGITVESNGKGKFFHILNGFAIANWRFTSKQSFVDAFNQCPPLAAVLLRVGIAAAKGKVWVLKQNSEDESRSEFGKNLRRLFKKPNPIQGWEQFYAQVIVYKRLYGYAPIITTNPAGFGGVTEKTKMWCLPPWFVDIEISKKLLSATDMTDLLDKVEFTYKGKKDPLDIKNLILLRDYTPTMNLEDAVLPQSRNLSLALPIAGIVSAYKSNNVLIKKKGGLGIIGNNTKDAIGSVALKDTEKKEIEEKLHENYGLTEDQFQVIVSNAALTYTPMVFDTTQLGIHETISNYTKEVCNVHGYPFKLLASDKSTGLNSNELKEASISLYNDTIQPEVDADFRVFADFFKCEEFGIDLLCDFSEIDVLQENKKEAATARLTFSRALEIDWKNNMITRNMYLKQLGFDEIDGKEGDEYYWQFIARTKPEGDENADKPPTNNN